MLMRPPHAPFGVPNKIGCGVGGCHRAKNHECRRHRSGDADNKRAGNMTRHFSRHQATPRKSMDF
jgi:hypothetical protein